MSNWHEHTRPGCRAAVVTAALIVGIPIAAAGLPLLMLALIDATAGWW